MTGLIADGPISADDVITVRKCGRSIVEKLREEAAAGDASGLQALNIEAATGAGQMPRQRWLQDCLKKVLIDERDTILAR